MVNNQCWPKQFSHTRNKKKKYPFNWLITTGTLRNFSWQSLSRVINSWIMMMEVKCRSLEWLACLYFLQSFFFFVSDTHTHTQTIMDNTKYKQNKKSIESNFDGKVACSSHGRPYGGSKPSWSSQRRHPSFPTTWAPCYSQDRSQAPRTLLFNTIILGKLHAPFRLLPRDKRESLTA